MKLIYLFDLFYLLYSRASIIRTSLNRTTAYPNAVNSEILDLMTNKADATTSSTSTASSDNGDEKIVSVFTND